MSNSLTRRTFLGLLPLVVGILLRHYYSRLPKGKGKEHDTVPLRRKDLAYDEAFCITRNILDRATRHTVDEMQKFTQLRVPLPPSVHVVRFSVPLSCSTDAARVLIKVFGGEREMKRVLGGVRWWQVRAGDQGINAEWIMEKKDWQRSIRQERSPTGDKRTNGEGSQSQSASSSLPRDHNAGMGSPDDADLYRPEMDEMKCLLWAHGGGYFCGSVGQERHMLQRYARKIQGRVLAPNYRLAPQYPFPCALQDFLASYLFLLQPPEGAPHLPVKPCDIIIGGDSAGGGLALALLQVIRDAGLPQPAGAVLISPWCDLHHSFPSIFLNTDTDFVPATGLVLFKPSALWPPPSDELHLQIRDQSRSRTRGVIHAKSLSEAEAPAITADQPVIQPRFELGPPATVPSDQTLLVAGKDGEPLRITRQIQLYTTNALLKHPLVSPVLGYLGGLPPLFIVACDREVLRDEIIYTAHRAANPEKYPVLEETKELYSALVGVERRMKPTMVHLQVYDDAAHVLPLVFGTTTPAKYCYRAIATFIKHVTNMPPTTALQRHKGPPAPSPSIIILEDIVASPVASSPLDEDRPGVSSQVTKERSSSRPKGFSRIASSFRRGNSTSHSENAFEDTFAGDPIVYHGRWAKSPEHQGMIRERVSIQGVIRPLEGEQELPALQISPELLGTISELWVHRYVAGTARHEKKFAVHSKKQIAKLHRRPSRSSHSRSPSTEEQEAEVSGSSTGWTLAWALEVDERPPPSSLVARHDIAEKVLAPTKRRRLRHADATLSKEEEERRAETKGRARVGTFWKGRGTD